jgi:hypothetical protein
MIAFHRYMLITFYSHVTFTQVNQKGISIQLTKSEIKGVRLMAFEAHVRSTVSLPAAAGGEGQAGEEGEEAQQQEQSQLHVFDVVVQVRRLADVTHQAVAPRCGIYICSGLLPLIAHLCQSL